jgi:hypothetical protein
MIVEDIIAAGGGTLDGVTLEPVTFKHGGYAVAIHYGTAMEVGRLLPGWHSGIAQAVIAVRDTFRPPYVGVWIDPDGVAHIDPVVILYDRESAVTIGRAFGQTSIYDFSAAKDVTL